MTSKYIDIPAIAQVIGCVYNDPSLLDKTEKYVFNEKDFPQDIHRILFGSIYNLHAFGINKMNINLIEDYLKDKPKYYSTFKSLKGAEYLIRISEGAEVSSFNYYYDRLKKMSLFRAYESIGFNLSWLYDCNEIISSKKRQDQEEWLDTTSIDSIISMIQRKIETVSNVYDTIGGKEAEKAGDGAAELIEKLKEAPEIGLPIYGNLINAITGGEILKKLYLVSAPQGTMKTRFMVCNATYTACDEIFDIKKNTWIKNGLLEPTLYITTEQEKSEIQTMMLAFLSRVDESIILNGKYRSKEEEERVKHAAEVISRSPLYIKELPDFTIADVESLIKISVLEKGVKYVFYDYVHTSLKILTEISSKAKIQNIREDQILLMLMIILKDLCNKYGIFIMTGSQLSGQYNTAERFDQSLLRGAKSLSDKIDIGMIGIQATDQDREALKIITDSLGCGRIEIKIAIYKNRRRRYKNILLWCSIDLGTCRVEPQFVTDYNYNLIDIEDIKIEVIQ